MHLIFVRLERHLLLELLRAAPVLWAELHQSSDPSSRDQADCENVAQFEDSSGVSNAVDFCRLEIVVLSKQCL